MKMSKAAPREIIPRVQQRGKWTMTIMTGASDNHHKSLCKLLQCLRTKARRARVWVYDLGLTGNALAAVRDVVNKYPRQMQLRTFDYANEPAFVNIHTNAGHYAWKPIIIFRALQELRGTGQYGFWLDAGCRLASGLKRVHDAVARVGLWSPVSSGHIAMWTHQRTLKAMHATARDLIDNNRSGGVVAFDPEHNEARYIIGQWYTLARQKHILAPKGSSRKNHRQDQSLLSVLIAQSVRRGTLVDPPWGMLGVRVHCDIG